MKNYREAGPSRPTTSNIQQPTNAIKIDASNVQDHQPQQVQVQYVDQDGNVIHVVNQPASFVTAGDNNALYVNNGPNDPNYENA